MLAATADLTIAGRGLQIRLHGEGSALFADVSATTWHPDLLGVVSKAIVLARPISNLLRSLGLCVTIRIANTAIAHLGR